MANFFSTNGGYSPSENFSLARSHVVQWLENEAYCTSINDDFYIGMILALIAIVPVLFLNIKKSNS